MAGLQNGRQAGRVAPIHPGRQAGGTRYPGNGRTHPVWVLRLVVIWQNAGRNGGIYGR